MDSHSEIDFEEVYWLNDPLADQPLRCEFADEALLSLGNGPLPKGEYEPDRPIKYVRFMGGKPCDFIWTGMGFPLISARVVELLEENSIAGWKTYPVEVYGKSNQRVPGYSGLAITGRCGRIDESMSRRALRPPVVPQGKPYWVLIGLFFDCKSWSGHDFFIPKDTGFILVTSRVRHCFENAKIRNVRFSKITEIEDDVRE